MRRFIRAWRGLPAEHKDYFFVYVAGILWATSYLIFTPPTTLLIVWDRVVIVLWLASTLVGAIMALYGLLIRDNLLVEKFGVTILTVTPLFYMVLQAGLIFLMTLDNDPATDPTSLVHLIFLSLWLWLFLNKRRRQLSRRSRLASITPLPSETEEGKA